MTTDPTITAIGTPQDEVELPSTGTPVGRYLVVRELGAGAMGVVFLASDGQLGRHVALKVLTQHSRGNRLLDEARALARLQHPNVVAIHDVGSWNERVYMAMEYVDGESLADWLKTHAGWRERLGAFVQAAHGLAAAHRAGIVHHDVKPSNIMVGDDGRVRLVDFGLARSPSADVTQGSPGGTPRYMSPEQRRGEVVDARTDQFSLCLALYEALYGEYPFEGDSPEERDEAIESGRVKPPSTSAIPEETRDAIVKGLAYAPEDRHRTMEALLAALAPPPAGRRWWIGAALGLVGVAAIGAVVLARGRSHDAPPPGRWDAILAASQLPPEQPQPLADDPLHVTVHRLKNGLTVYLSPNHEKPRVRAMFRFHAGQVDDLGASGVAQGMSYKGTDRIGTIDYAIEKPLLDQIRALEQRRATADPAERTRVTALSEALATLASAFEVPNEYSRVLQDFGVSQNHGATLFDTTTFEVEIASNRLGAWAELEADRWAHPVMRLFRSQVAETLGWDRDLMADLTARTSNALLTKLFPGHPYGIDSRSHRAAIANTSLADVERFFHSYFVPNDAELILAGDVDPVTTIPVLERAFASWEPRALPPRDRVPLQPLPADTSVVVPSTGDRRVAEVWRGPSYEDPDAPAFEVVQDLVERLGRERMRERRVGWFKTWISVYDQAAVFAVVADADRASLDDAAAELDAVVDTVRAGKFSDELLATAKRGLRASQLLEIRDNAGRIAAIAQRAVGASWREHVEREATRERVTRDDVVRIAGRWLGAQHLVVRIQPGKVELDPLELPRVPPVLFPDRRSAAALALAQRDVVPIQPKFLLAGRDYEERDTPAGHVITALDRGSEVFELHAMYSVGGDEYPFACTALTARNVGMRSQLAEAGVELTPLCTQSTIDLKLVGLDRDLPRALELLDQATSELAPEDWETAKVATRQWVDGLHSNPTWVQWLAEAVAVFGSTSYFANMMGPSTRADADVSVGLAALQVLQRIDRTIGYSGPRSIDEVVQLLPARFPAMKAAKRMAKLVGGPPRVLLLNVPTASNGVNISLAFGMTRIREREDKVQMYNAYWGSDLNPVAHRLRGVTKLEPTITWPTRRNEPGYLVFRAATDATHVTEVVRSTLAGIFDSDVDPALVERAKAGWEERLRSDWVATSLVPFAVWRWHTFGELVDPRPAYFEHLASAGKRDMDAIAAELRQAPRVIVLWGDLSHVDRGALARFGAVSELPAEDVFERPGR